MGNILPCFGRRGISSPGLSPGFIATTLLVGLFSLGVTPWCIGDKNTCTGCYGVPSTTPAWLNQATDSIRKDFLLTAVTHGTPNSYNSATGWWVVDSSNTTAVAPGGSTIMMCPGDMIAENAPNVQISITPTGGHPVSFLGQVFQSPMYWNINEMNATMANIGIVCTSISLGNVGSPYVILSPTISYPRLATCAALEGSDGPAGVAIQPVNWMSQTATDQAVQRVAVAYISSTGLPFQTGLNSATCSQRGCGVVNSGYCGCDYSCVAKQDCCPDYVLVCQPTAPVFLQPHSWKGLTYRDPGKPCSCIAVNANAYTPPEGTCTIMSGNGGTVIQSITTPACRRVGDPQTAPGFGEVVTCCCAGDSCDAQPNPCDTQLFNGFALLPGIPGNSGILTDRGLIAGTIPLCSNTGHTWAFVGLPNLDCRPSDLFASDLARNLYNLMLTIGIPAVSVDVPTSCLTEWQQAYTLASGVTYKENSFSPADMCTAVMSPGDPNMLGELQTIVSGCSSTAVLDSTTTTVGASTAVGTGTTASPSPTETSTSPATASLTETATVGSIATTTTSAAPGMTGWVLGAKGQSCTSTCGTSPCNVESIRLVATQDIFLHAFSQAGGDPSVCQVFWLSDFPEDPSYFLEEQCIYSTGSATCGATEPSSARLCCCGIEACDMPDNVVTTATTTSISAGSTQEANTGGFTEGTVRSSTEVEPQTTDASTAHHPETSGTSTVSTVVPSTATTSTLASSTQEVNTGWLTEGTVQSSTEAGPQTTDASTAHHTGTSGTSAMSTVMPRTHVHGNHPMPTPYHPRYSAFEFEGNGPDPQGSNVTAYIGNPVSVDAGLIGSVSAQYVQVFPLDLLVAAPTLTEYQGTIWTLHYYSELSGVICACAPCPSSGSVYVAEGSAPETQTASDVAYNIAANNCGSWVSGDNDGYHCTIPLDAEQSDNPSPCVDDTDAWWEAICLADGQNYDLIDFTPESPLDFSTAYYLNYIPVYDPNDDPFHASRSTGFFGQTYHSCYFPSGECIAIESFINPMNFSRPMTKRPVMGPIVSNATCLGQKYEGGDSGGLCTAQSSDATCLTYATEPVQGTCVGPLLNGSICNGLYLLASPFQWAAADIESLEAHLGVFLTYTVQSANNSTYLRQPSGLCYKSINGTTNGVSSCDASPLLDEDAVVGIFEGFPTFSSSGLLYAFHNCPGLSLMNGFPSCTNSRRDLNQDNFNNLMLSSFAQVTGELASLDVGIAQSINNLAYAVSALQQEVIVDDSTLTDMALDHDLRLRTIEARLALLGAYLLAKFGDDPTHSEGVTLAPQSCTMSSASLYCNGTEVPYYYSEGCLLFIDMSGELAGQNVLANGACAADPYYMYNVSLIPNAVNNMLVNVSAETAAISAESEALHTSITNLTQQLQNVANNISAQEAAENKALLGRLTDMLNQQSDDLDFLSDAFEDLSDAFDDLASWVPDLLKGTSSILFTVLLIGGAYLVFSFLSKRRSINPGVAQHAPTYEPVRVVHTEPAVYEYAESAHRLASFNVVVQEIPQRGERPRGLLFRHRGEVWYSTSHNSFVPSQIAPTGSVPGGKATVRENVLGKPVGMLVTEPKELAAWYNPVETPSNE